MTRKRLTIASRPRITTTRRSLLWKRDTARLQEWGRKVRHVRVPDWPLCRRCRSIRRRWIVPAALMFWGGLACLVGVFVTNAVAGPLDPALSSLMLIAAFGLVLGSVLPFVRGSYLRITGARTSDDGTAVIVDLPHPVFVAEAAPLLTDAGR